MLSIDLLHDKLPDETYEFENLSNKAFGLKGNTPIVQNPEVMLEIDIHFDQASANNAKNLKLGDHSIRICKQILVANLNPVSFKWFEASMWYLVVDYQLWYMEVDRIISHHVQLLVTSSKV